MNECELCHNSSNGTWGLIEIKANSKICKECSNQKVLPKCAKKSCVKIVCENCAKQIRKEREKIQL